MKKPQILAVFFIVGTFSVFSQTGKEIDDITKNYNKNEIIQKISLFEEIEKIEKQKALEAAKSNGWPEFVKESDGTFKELMKLTPDGFPIYYSTMNAAAARSTRTNHLNTGGSLGLNLNGQGMVARVWDGGTVRRTHNFLSGRVTTVDDVSGTTYSNHATHVTGTIVASDASPSVKGMAFQATARTFNWTNDTSEALSEVLGGMLISNHSYGVPITNGTNILPAWYIGAYTEDARIWDEIAYSAPYYLPVKSAGNSGGDNNNSEPIAPGFDKLTGNKTAKNALIIANANDANVSDAGLLISVSINGSSSQGPTDDRRIKPDITGNGTGVTSTASSSNTATQSLSGTSMSSPNVAGTLLLLQQHYKNITNSFMKAATLKGLACHTADDAGAVGPDPRFGWGLLNAKLAAQTITNNGLSSWVSEENLAQSSVFTKTVIASGFEPLIASITWTDVPGVANNGDGPVNDPTPALVNDLDIRITRDGVTYFPWRLQSNPTLAATRNSDNNVDNVEIIKIDFPTPGEYLITVTHKGTLVNNQQDYSLVVTGITSDFSIVSKSEDLIVCDSQDAVFVFDYRQVGGGTTNFSATGLPSGATATFNPVSRNTNGDVIMTISGLNNVSPGEYSVGIIGNNGIETETRFKKLRIYSTSFNNIVLTQPTNGQNTVPTNTTLSWDSSQNAEMYKLQVASNSDFSTIFLDIDTAETSWLVTGLAEETTYYWRVIPSNRCGVASTSGMTAFNFETGRLTCGSTFTATDFSNATIGTTANSIATVPIEITGGLEIGQITVSIDISHTYIQDMKIYLEGPASIGSSIITLFDEPCTIQDNIVCTLSDTGLTFTCSATPPGISGIVKPLQNLASLNNLIADGTWILRVVDSWNGDGGSINSVVINVCSIETSLSTLDDKLSSVKIYPNPSKGIININLGKNLTGETTYVLYDVQGRIVMNKKSNATMETLNVENVSNGVYLLSIENGAAKTTQKIIINK